MKIPAFVRFYFAGSVLVRQEFSFVKAVNFPAEMASCRYLIVFAHIFNVLRFHGMKCVKQFVAAATAPEVILLGFGDFQIIGVKKSG